ncbi:MAG: exodeoxyribonuclease III [Alphaproteobacteria bacterium]|nr:exodeoxyribonuclease III [Alphaproteobacteria bacterium]
MHIATWNVNSLKTRVDIIKEWLTANPVDFLLLQEIKGENEEIFKEFESLGYKSYFHLQKTYNGVAILAKNECKVINKNLPNFEDAQARFIEVEHKNIHILNAYMPNGNPIISEDNKFAYKISWLNHMYLYLQSLIENNIDFILAGDFNIAPYDIDVYSVKAFANDALTSKPARDIYFKMLNLGLLDSLRFKNPNTKNLFTWWDYRNAGFAKDDGVRIDHILLSPRLADGFVDCFVDKVPRLKDKPSDHTPVICKIDFN